LKLLLFFHINLKPADALELFALLGGEVFEDLAEVFEVGLIWVDGWEQAGYPIKVIGGFL